jgi:hypothetical protein
MCVIVASAFDLFFLLPLVFSYADSVKMMCNDVQLVKVQLGMPSDVSEFHLRSAKGDCHCLPSCQFVLQVLRCGHLFSINLLNDRIPWSAACVSAVSWLWRCRSSSE